MKEELTDREKLLALSLLYQLYRDGKISDSEIKKILSSEKELIKKYSTEFSSFFGN
ncbi:MAG: hypothetical protein NC489_37180 [Ruminococcus flavefaciens]|nr:hypothetical protein [Ruminococcus flavefaciens]